MKQTGLDPLMVIKVLRYFTVLFKKKAIVAPRWDQGIEN